MEAALTSTPSSGAANRSLLHKTGALLQRTWVRCALLALFGFAVHFPSLQGQLIWDDQYLARDNPFIKSPVLSAAVDYISGRADSLAFFFACGSWLLYLRGRDAKRPAVRGLVFLLAALSLLLALCSRESASLWVAMFLGHLFVFEKTTTRRTKFTALIACLLIVGCY